MRIEAMPEIGLGDRIPRPVRRLGVEKDDAGFRVLFVRVAPDIVVPMTGAGWRVSRALEPRVLIRSVVHHEFRYDAQHARVRLADEAAQVRSEEPPSELQSLMPISFAGFCLK